MQQHLTDNINFWYAFCRQVLCRERNLGKKFILDNLQSRFKTPHQFILDTDPLCALLGNILLLTPVFKEGC